MPHHDRAREEHGESSLPPDKRSCLAIPGTPLSHRTENNGQRGSRFDFGRLGEMWVDRDPAAGASVVVGASAMASRSGCFAGNSWLFRIRAREAPRPAHDRDGLRTLRKKGTGGSLDRLRMDRALNLDNLTTALGNHALLPSAANLQRLLADAEVGLFTQQSNVGPELLDAGWYLQSIASARADLQLFPLERRRLAHQVSAHIFDLALTSPRSG